MAYDGAGRRVAITGVGLATALGIGVDTTWPALVAGRTAVGPIEGFDASALRTRVGAEVESLDAATFMTRRQARSLMKVDRFALVAARLAAADGAVLGEGDGSDPERRALFLASAKEISELGELLDVALGVCDEHGRVDFGELGRQAPSRIPPLIFVEGLQAASLFWISAALRMMGANTFFAGSADAGMSALGAALRCVRRGDADVALAGGYDACVDWWPMTSADGLGVLTPSDGPGGGVCRPFDVAHDGTVMGEGAVVLALEPFDDVRARGRRARALLAGIGYGHRRDASPDGRAAAVTAACVAALRDAGADPQAVCAIVAHGSGVPEDDRAEVQGLAELLGAHAAEVPVTAVKGAVGHMGAAAGPLNVAVAALALADGALPPIAGLRQPDDGDATLAWVTGASAPIGDGVVLALAMSASGQVVAAAVRPAPSGP